MRLIQGRRGFSSVLSLQFLEDKQHLGGEDCNVPKFAHSNLEHYIFLLSPRRGING